MGRIYFYKLTVDAGVRKHQPQAIAYNARLAFGSFSIVPIEHTIP
jgi:hypothetical protein